MTFVLTQEATDKYDQAKKIFADKMWKRVVEVLQQTGATVPHSLDEVDHYDVATPLTFEHFYKSDRGGWYGVEMDMNRMKPETFFLKLRPRVHGVNGLFLTGQDVMSMGIEPCAMSGVMCAAAVLGRKGGPFAILELEM
jgi:all-trans-retinol 13,14-reductase